jgi:uncharacterized protein YjbI with pentapeptide repeats
MGIIQKIKAKLAPPAPVQQPTAVMNRLAGKKVCFAGKFQYGKYGPLARYMALAEAQQGKIVEELDGKTDMLVLADLNASKTLQKQVLKLNAKGASIQVLDGDTFLKLVEPSTSEALAVIRGGKSNAEVFKKIFRTGVIQIHSPNSPSSAMATFVGETFAGLDLEGFDFSQVAFTNCSFVGCNLTKATFLSATHCDFTGTTAQSCTFGDVESSRFTKAQMREAKFHGNLTNADFSAAILDQAAFSRHFLPFRAVPATTATGCVFARAQLLKATFGGTHFVAPDFDGADLCGAIFRSTVLESASFRNALVRNASLLSCRLMSANFSDADCRQTNFADANLADTRFDGADLDECNFRGANLQGVDLGKAKNYSLPAAPVGSVGPSLTELDSLAQQAKNIHITFRIKIDSEQEGEVVGITTRTLKYGWGLHVPPSLSSGRLIPKPNQSLSDIMLHLANIAVNRKVRYETVEVKSTKSPKTGKALRDLVIAGIAEAFAQPVPPAAELAAAMKAIRTTKTTQGAEARRQREEYKRRQEELKKRELKKIEKTIEKQVGKITDIATFLKALELRADKSKIDKATKMLKAERFQLFNDITDTHLNGVVKSQTDADLVYACRIESNGHYACCTQNLNICGGLRGSICKHLLVLIVGLVKAGQLDPSTIDAWIAKTHDTKPELNKETMGEIFIRYKGAEAGEVDWRPTETVPEDYYAV